MFRVSTTIDGTEIKTKVLTIIKWSIISCNVSFEHDHDYDLCVAVTKKTEKYQKMTLEKKKQHTIFLLIPKVLSLGLGDLSWQKSSMKTP